MRDAKFRSWRPLEALGRYGLQLKTRQVAPGVLQVLTRTRATGLLGFPCCCYLVEDLLIDTGHPNARSAILAELEGKPLRAIALTHHHEDHSGNAGPLAARAGCPVYLRDVQGAGSEGVDRIPAYRRLVWGVPPPYRPQEMPALVESSARQLRVLATPGHSLTHSAFIDLASGLAFTGDLLVSRGASAVMRYEHPSQSVRSLRALAALEPRLLLTGHGPPLDKAVPRLLAKAQRVEEAIEQVRELHAQGLSSAEIRRKIFPGSQRADLFTAAFTGGEFSRACFVRAVLC